METISYELTTCSSVIVSPRSALAFYKDLGEFTTIKKDQDYLEEKKLKIIYPFYQYGIYEAYDPDHANYYLPGSSIKGALCQGAAARNLMVDDVPIQNKDITLRNLYKAQYLDNEGEACFGEFFNHVGVEMIRGNATLTGRFNHDNLQFARTLLKSANKATRLKIEQMKKYLKELIEKESYKKTLSKPLQAAFDQLSTLSADEQVVLLGGYKGLLHSMEVKETQQETAGAIYLDPETKLPHGLVKIVLR